MVTQAMEIEKADLQKRIRKGNLILFDLVESIEKLPHGEARTDLEIKHDAVLQRLNDLHEQLGQVDETACWYGFAPKCPGYLCEDCFFLRQVMKLTHIVTIEEFDQQRIKWYEQYKKERKSAEDFQIYSTDDPGW